MTQFITLTAAEADKLRGITSPGHAIEPIPLDDGVTFILPVEVLADPAHAKFIAEKKKDVDITKAAKRRVVPEGEFKKPPVEIQPVK